MLSFKRYDKYGEEITPGSICFYSRRDKVEMLVFKEYAPRGRTDRYGRFISDSGVITVQTSSVVFGFDPFTKRVNKSSVSNELINKYYGG